MNIITASTAYCLYPRGTLILRKSLAIENVFHHGADSIRAKYAGRGWPFFESRNLSSSDRVYVEQNFHVGKRSLGDDQCLSIPLCTVGLDFSHSQEMIGFTCRQWELRLGDDAQIKIKYEGTGVTPSFVFDKD